MNLERQFMEKSLLSIEDFNLKDKKVFIRADLNAPIKQGVIQSPHRIINALPTIRCALDQKAKIILASHLGRPQGRQPALSLAPVAEKLGELLDIDVLFAENTISDVPALLASSLKENRLILLENLRFQSGEKSNDEDLARKLAQDIDIYINDAFGVCHRKHASLCALPEKIEKRGIGFLIKKEMEFLDQIRNNPQCPFTAVLGGAKVQDKMGLILSLIDNVDSMVVGGPMAYVFLKSQGADLGATPVDESLISKAGELIERFKARNKKIYLPIDHVTAPSMEKTHQAQTTKDVNIPKGHKAFDIGPRTVDYFAEAFGGVKTIFWNGPMGVFEIEAYETGTKKIAQLIAQTTNTFKVVGGGDSARAIEKYSLSSSIDHVSTGGGASLAYIQGKKLPALESVKQKRF